MHLVDLSIIPDLAISVFLDWTDSDVYVDQPTRQKRLDHFAAAYRDWVGNTSDRVNRKLFTTDVLKPGASAFTAVSQHYISAAAARGLIVFLSKVAEQYAREHGAPLDLWMGSKVRNFLRKILFTCVRTKLWKAESPRTQLFCGQNCPEAAIRGLFGLADDVQREPQLMVLLQTYWALSPKFYELHM